jgi:hypothetical protein
LLKPLTPLYIVCHTSLEVNKLTRVYLDLTVAIVAVFNVDAGYWCRIRHLSCRNQLSAVRLILMRGRCDVMRLQSRHVGLAKQLLVQLILLLLVLQMALICTPCTPNRTHQRSKSAGPLLKLEDCAEGSER